MIYFFHYGRQKGEKVMEKNKKNNSTGLYSLHIGNKLFKSKKAKLFTVDLTEIEKILVSDLPLNIKIRLKKPVNRVKLSLIRSNSNIIEIFISEHACSRYWCETINVQHYFMFKANQIVKDLSILPQLHLAAGFDVDAVLDYSLKLTAATLGEVVKKALTINKSFDDRIDHASRKALSCMELVLGGGLQIKLPDHLFGKNKKDKNSKV